MSRGPDVATLLTRALAADAEAAGCPVEIVAAVSSPWASVTFAGARHVIALTATASPQFDAWLAALPEAEFALRGHLVADLALGAMRAAGGRRTAELEILTVEER